MSVQIATPPSIVLTKSAAKRVYDLIQEENDLTLKLRVYIEGGGCSGFQYGFTFDDCKNDDDLVISRQVESDDKDCGKGAEGFEVQLLIDALSFQYLVGAEIDYVDDMEGERFIIRNPNAQTTCGCGSSFSV